MKHPRISTRDHDGTCVVAAVGEFDMAEAYLLREAFQAALEKGNQIVVDLTETTFMDSSVLGTLIGGNKLAAERGGWLRLVNPQPIVLKVLRITQMDSALGVYDSVEQAVSGS